MTLTPKQRETIYRKAAEEIRISRDPMKQKFCCYTLHSVSRRLWVTNLLYYWEFVNKLNFPELFLFKPKNKLCLDLWWDIHEINERVLALLFCAEMCKSDVNKLSKNK